MELLELDLKPEARMPQPLFAHSAGFTIQILRAFMWG